MTSTPKKTLRKAVATSGSSEGRAPPTPETGTLLVAVRGGAWGDIVIDGVARGRTGAGAIDIAPGKHTLELRNPMAMPHRQTIEIAAGERREVLVDGLTPKMVVTFADALPGACIVVLDGRAAGRIDEIGRSLDVADPTRGHALEPVVPGRPRDISIPSDVPGSVVGSALP